MTRLLTTAAVAVALLLLMQGCADTSPAAVEACGKACAPFGVKSMTRSDGCQCNPPREMPVKDGR